MFIFAYVRQIHPGIEIGTEISAVFSTEREVEDRPGAFFKLHLCWNLSQWILPVFKSNIGFWESKKKEMIKELRDNEICIYIHIHVSILYTRYFDVYCLLAPTFHYPHVVELILALMQEINFGGSKLEMATEQLPASRLEKNSNIWNKQTLCKFQIQPTK